MLLQIVCKCQCSLCRHAFTLKVNEPLGNLPQLTETGDHFCWTFSQQPLERLKEEALKRLQSSQNKTNDANTTKTTEEENCNDASSNQHNAQENHHDQSPTEIEVQNDLYDPSTLNNFQEPTNQSDRSPETPVLTACEFRCRTCYKVFRPMKVGLKVPKLPTRHKRKGQYNILRYFGLQHDRERNSPIEDAGKKRRIEEYGEQEDMDSVRDQLSPEPESKKRKVEDVVDVIHDEDAGGKSDKEDEPCNATVVHADENDSTTDLSERASACTTVSPNPVQTDCDDDAETPSTNQEDSVEKKDEEASSDPTKQANGNVSAKQPPPNSIDENIQDSTISSSCHAINSVGRGETSNDDCSPDGLGKEAQREYPSASRDNIPDSSENQICNEKRKESSPKDESNDKNIATTQEQTHKQSNLRPISPLESTERDASFKSDVNDTNRCSSDTEEEYTVGKACFSGVKSRDEKRSESMKNYVKQNIIESDVDDEYIVGKPSSKQLKAREKRRKLAKLKMDINRFKHLTHSPEQTKHNQFRLKEHRRKVRVAKRTLHEKSHLNDSDDEYVVGKPTYNQLKARKIRREVIKANRMLHKKAHLKRFNESKQTFLHWQESNHGTGQLSILKRSHDKDADRSYDNARDCSIKVLRLTEAQIQQWTRRKDLDADDINDMTDKLADGLESDSDNQMEVTVVRVKKERFDNDLDKDHLPISQLDHPTLREDMESESVTPRLPPPSVIDDNSSSLDAILNMQTGDTELERSVKSNVYREILESFGVNSKPASPKMSQSDERLQCQNLSEMKADNEGVGGGMIVDMNGVKSRVIPLSGSILPGTNTLPLTPPLISQASSAAISSPVIGQHMSQSASSLQSIDVARAVSRQIHIPDASQRNKTVRINPSLRLPCTDTRLKSAVPSNKNSDPISQGPSYQNTQLNHGISVNEDLGINIGIAANQNPGLNTGMLGHQNMILSNQNVGMQPSKNREVTSGNVMNPLPGQNREISLYQDSRHPPVLSANQDQVFNQRISSAQNFKLTPGISSNVKPERNPENPGVNPQLINQNIERSSSQHSRMTSRLSTSVNPTINSQDEMTNLGLPRFPAPVLNSALVGNQSSDRNSGILANPYLYPGKMNRIRMPEFSANDDPILSSRLSNRLPDSRTIAHSSMGQHPSSRASEGRPVLEASQGSYWLQQQSSNTCIPRSSAISEYDTNYTSYSQTTVNFQQFQIRASTHTQVINPVETSFQQHMPRGPPGMMRLNPTSQTRSPYNVSYPPMMNNGTQGGGLIPPYPPHMYPSLSQAAIHPTMAATTMTSGLPCATHYAHQYRGPFPF